LSKDRLLLLMLRMRPTRAGSSHPGVWTAALGSMQSDVGRRRVRRQMFSALSPLSAVIHAGQPVSVSCRTRRLDRYVIGVVTGVSELTL